MTGHVASVDLVQLLALARDIAVQAAEFAAAARLAGVEVAATKSTPTDIVTATDRDTEALIRERILAARPDDGILGEEDTARVGTSGLTWVVDPIDGTVNFLYGLPSWAVSIAVVEGPAEPSSWHALVGVVVNGSTGEVFEASAGGGARVSGGVVGGMLPRAASAASAGSVGSAASAESAPQALQVNTGVPLARALVGTGFGYSAERRREQAEVLLAVLPQVRDVRRNGSAALEMSALAAGRLDAFYERGLAPWDHAAGALIAREAGAVVGGARGGREGEELVVAAAPGLYEELVAALAAAGAGT
ncbi:inositol monophosphatase family protein [Agromyces italicus]|uniref:inositol monophosphatase family protein n=1 Tax=Agromyces italicus TaxID=279572 RepID=UPI0003B3D554|nr:inositol monophosphatase family protein [Agromyces italicus]